MKFKPTSLTKRVYLSDKEVMLMSNMQFYGYCPTIGPARYFKRFGQWAPPTISRFF